MQNTLEMYFPPLNLSRVALHHSLKWRPRPSTCVTPHSHNAADYLILKYAMSQVCHGWMDVKPSGIGSLQEPHNVVVGKVQGFTEWSHPMSVLLSLHVNYLIHCPDGFCCCNCWIRVDENTRTPCRIPNRCLYQSFLTHAQTFGGRTVCCEVFKCCDIFSNSSFTLHNPPSHCTTVENILYGPL